MATEVLRKLQCQDTSTMHFPFYELASRVKVKLGVHRDENDVWFRRIDLTDYTSNLFFRGACRDLSEDKSFRVLKLYAVHTFVCPYAGKLPVRSFDQYDVALFYRDAEGDKTLIGSSRELRRAFEAVRGKGLIVLIAQVVKKARSSSAVTNPWLSPVKPEARSRPPLAPTVHPCRFSEMYRQSSGSMAKRSMAGLSQNNPKLQSPLGTKQKSKKSKETLDLMELVMGLMNSGEKVKETTPDEFVDLLSSSAESSQDALASITGEEKTSKEPLHLLSLENSSAESSQNALASTTGDEKTCKDPLDPPSLDASSAESSQNALASITGDETCKDPLDPPSLDTSSAESRQDALASITGDGKTWKDPLDPPSVQSHSLESSQNAMAAITAEETVSKEDLRPRGLETSFDESSKDAVALISEDEPEHSDGDSFTAL